MDNRKGSTSEKTLSAKEYQKVYDFALRLISSLQPERYDMGLLILKIMEELVELREFRIARENMRILSEQDKTSPWKQRLTQQVKSEPGEGDITQEQGSVLPKKRGKRNT